MTIEELLARQEITDVLYRYCRGIDRMDEDLVAACYHAGATDSHGSFSGTAEEFRSWCFGLLEAYDRTFHFLGNILIEFATPEAADVESYGIAHHRRVGGATHHNLVTGFRFVDRFTRVDGVWAVAERVTVTDWSSVDASPWPIADDRMIVGRRDRFDPVFGQRR